MPKKTLETFVCPDCNKPVRTDRILNHTPSCVPGVPDIYDTEHVIFEAYEKTIAKVSDVLRRK
jgi:hypothetical protein